jgi:hypothetical protein
MRDMRLNVSFTSARDSLRDRVRAALTPSSVWATLRTLMWLAPLTILIWYTAETSRYEQRERPIRVRMVDDRGRNAQLQEPRSGVLTVTFRGQRAALDLLDARLAQDVDLRLKDTGEGEVQIPVEPLLRDSPSLRGIRFQVVQSNPPVVRLNVEPFEERQVPVRLPGGLQNVTAQFDPPNVTIRAPASVIRAAETAGTLAAEADVASLAMLRQPGKKDPQQVGLLTPLRTADAVTISPQTVTATLVVGEADETFTIQSMPVFVSAPADFNDEYRVTLEPSSVYNAQVAGPGESVRLLSERKFAPLARVELSAEDINRLRGGQTIAKRPSFVLPDGVRIEASSLESITINCTAQRRGG